MIKDLMREAKRGGLFAVATLVIIFSCAGGLLWILLYLADSTFLSERKVNVAAESKSYTPEFWTTTMIMSGKTMVPMTTHYPESWEVTIAYDFESASCPVSESQFDAVSANGRVDAMLTVGRFSGSMYCNGIAIPEPK